MNIQAIWENGIFRPLAPLNLKHELVTIQVPDEELATDAPTTRASAQSAFVLSPEVQAMADQMMVELDRIRNAPLPPEDELPLLTEKQLSRIAAFARREDR